MDIVSIIILAAIAAAGAYLIMLYNNLVQIKHNISKA